MEPRHISRRSFGTFLALVAPAALVGHAAQVGSGTPPATPPATPEGELSFVAQVTALAPEDLLSRLRSEPFDPAWVVIPAEFASEDVPVEVFPEDEIGTALLGAVQIFSAHASDESNEQILGGYLVYESVEAATGATEALPRLLVRGQEQRAGTYVLPLSIAGLPGFTGVSDDYADSSLQVGYVIVIGSDIILADGARTTPESAVIRSSYYLTAMLDHLNRITRSG